MGTFLGILIKVEQLLKTVMNVFIKIIWRYCIVGSYVFYLRLWIRPGQCGNHICEEL